MMLPQHVLDRIRAINDAEPPLTPEQQRILQRAFSQQHKPQDDQHKDINDAVLRLRTAARPAPLVTQARRPAPPTPPRPRLEVAEPPVLAYRASLARAVRLAAVGLRVAPGSGGPVRLAAGARRHRGVPPPLAPRA